MDMGPGKAGVVLAGFFALHMVLWTLVPALVNPNLPLDAIEGLAWGQAWQWGYAKHPPLSAWLMELAYGLAPGRDWPLYLLSALSVTSAFWALWRLAADFLAPRPAAISVLLLAGVYYHNFTSPEINANVVLLPLWALTALCLWRAVSRHSLLAWGLFGLFGALGLLGKYFMIFLILPLGLFLVLDRESRAAWRTPGPYVAMAVALLVLAPHIRWMIEQDFVTVSYAVERSSSAAETWLRRHVAPPVRFFLAQAMALIPVAVLLFALGRPRRRAAVNPRQGRFLLFAGAGPLVIVLLAGLIFGLRLRSMWGTPLLLFSGLMAMSFFAPESFRRRRFAAVWSGIFILPLALYGALAIAEPYVAGKGKRTHFPGRALAAAVEAGWQRRFAGPLPAVIGPAWVAGNVAAYAAERPQVYIDGDPHQAPWLDDATLRDTGGAVVWEIGGQARRAPPPGNLAARFSCLEVQAPLALSWRTGAKLPPLRFGWALIAPAKACKAG